MPAAILTIVVTRRKSRGSGVIGPSGGAGGLYNNIAISRGLYKGDDISSRGVNQWNIFSGGLNIIISGDHPPPGVAAIIQSSTVLNFLFFGIRIARIQMRSKIFVLEFLLLVVGVVKGKPLLVS